MRSEGNADANTDDYPYDDAGEDGDEEDDHQDADYGDNDKDINAVDVETYFGNGEFVPEDKETENFHEGLKRTCDPHDKEYYEKFKKQCDEYFYLKHRKEPRGVGGVFFDYISNNFEKGVPFEEVFRSVK